MSLNSKFLFFQTDDLKGGLLQTWKRRLKFKMRFFRYQMHVEAIHQSLLQLGLKDILSSDAVILLRPFRSYLWAGLEPQGRANAVQQHFNWIVGQFGHDAALELYRVGSLPLATWNRDSSEVSVVLHPSRGLGREGELELHLCLDGQVVLRAAFSVLENAIVKPFSNTSMMVIGAVQGSRDGAELMRDLTKTMERVLPRTILIAALQGLASGCRLDGILGVASDKHVFVGYGRTLARRVAVDYDEIWSLVGGTHTDGASHWALPVQPRHRDLADIPSKKRAEYRRRNALLDQVFTDCCESAMAVATGASVENPSR